MLAQRIQDRLRWSAFRKWVTTASETASRTINSPSQREHRVDPSLPCWRCDARRLRISQSPKSFWARNGKQLVDPVTGDKNIRSRCRYPGCQASEQTEPPDKHIVRGDFRQEVDYPVQIDKIKGRPLRRRTIDELFRFGQMAARSTVLYGGAGVRMTNRVLEVDDTARSELFDIHRLRHVVEPEVNPSPACRTRIVTTSSSMTSPSIRSSNVSAAQACHCGSAGRPKRGGPGNWRSGRFLLAHVESEHIHQQPSKDDFPPGDFRGFVLHVVSGRLAARNSIKRRRAVAHQR